jgi:hypothetical protein
MKGWVLIALSAVVLVVLIAGCGSADPTTTTGVIEATTTTTGAPSTQSTEATTPSSASSEEGGSEAYANEMKEWFNKFEGELSEKADALDNIADPMNVSDEGIKAVKELAGLVDDVARDLEDIKPPAELSSPHSDYAGSLKSMALGMSQFTQAVEGGNLSDAVAASEAISAAVEKATGARDALEKALGFSLSSDDTKGGS